MKQLNLCVQLAQSPPLHKPRVVMCCLSIPNDVTSRDVEQAFKTAFIPTLAASIGHEDPFNLALSHTLSILEQEFCAEIYCVEADEIVVCITP